MAVISLVESDIQLAFWNLISSFGMFAEDGGEFEIVKGQQSRVSQPENPDYCLFWPIGNMALSYPIPADYDNIITGAINNNVLNVSSIQRGSITTGTRLFAPNLPFAGLRIIKQQSGDVGSVGNYLVSKTDNLRTQTFYCGVHAMTQPTQLTYQCDVHGPNSQANSQILYTCWKDGSSAQRAWQEGLPIRPLDASNPRQLNFPNAELQYEDRWLVDLMVQANPVINTTIEFADKAHVTLIPVETIDAEI